jgi:hypothetical protein
MRASLSAVLACLALTVSLNTVSRAERLEPAVYIRAAAVGTEWSLTNFKDSQNREQASLRAEGIIPDYEPIERTYGFALEGGVRMSSTWSMGLGYSYEKKSLIAGAEGTALVDDGFGGMVEAFTRVTHDYTLTLWEMSANLSYWIPFIPGLYLGASGGIAGGTLEETFVLDSESEGVTSSGMADGNYDKVDPVAGFFAGFQYEFRSAPLIYIEGGYRLRNVGEFDGTSAGSGAVDIAKPDGELTNFDGELVGDMDFSGWYARAGIGLAFN